MTGPLRSSSSSGISADALSQVKTLYTQESGPSQWPNPGPAFDSSKAKGKKVGPKAKKAKRA